MRLSLSASVLLSPSEDGYLLYDTVRARLHRLNPAASLIAELCDGTRDLDAIRESLLPLVGDTGWKACRAWIDEAREAGLFASTSDTVADRPALSAHALSDMALALRDRDQVLAAFICQQRAAELAPENPRMWYRLGELAHIVGRRDEARAAYERYFESHPDDAEIEHILRALRDEEPPDRVSDRCIEQLYARFASFYDDNMSADLDYRAPALLRDVVASVLGDRRQLDVVDLGCGTGLSGQSLRPFARRLTGVDLSQAMVERARRRGVYDDLRVEEITAFLARADGDPFDLIAACDAFIYFGDLRQVVTPAVRRLSSCGAIAFTVERGDTYPYRLTDSGRFAHHRDHIRDVAARAGLSIVHMEDAVLRYEYGDAVPGLVVGLRRADPA